MIDHILRHGLEELFLLQYFKFQNHSPTTFFYKIHVLRHAADWSLHSSLVALPAATVLEPSSDAGKLAMALFGPGMLDHTHGHDAAQSDASGNVDPVQQASSNERNIHDNISQAEDINSTLLFKCLAFCLFGPLPVRSD